MMSKGLEEFNKLKTWYILKMAEGNELLLRNNEKEMLDTIEEALNQSSICDQDTNSNLRMRLEKLDELEEKYLALLIGTNTPLSMEELLLFKNIGKELKEDEKNKQVLNIISQNFKLVGNCLHAKNKYAEDGWVFVKELEDEEEHNAWKEVLL